jgi:hypothetical protein
VESRADPAGSGTIVAGATGFALSLCLAVGQIVHGSPANSSVAGGGSVDLTSATYVARVTSILARFDVARQAGDRLLADRDADPRLSDDVRWRQDFSQVVTEHEGERAELASLAAPANASTVQACLSDGMRLTALGEGLLRDAFTADGHHAYYLSAHGNWDLNLGVTTLAHCRSSLASWQVNAN